MVLGLGSQGIFPHRYTNGELALRVGCDPDWGASPPPGRARFHLRARQGLAVLVQDAARKQYSRWHDEIAEISNIARRKQQWLALQGQLVRRQDLKSRASRSQSPQLEASLRIGERSANAPRARH